MILKFHRENYLQEQREQGKTKRKTELELGSKKWSLETKRGKRLGKIPASF